VAFSEPVTAARLRIYAEDLATDLSREQIAVALQRARRELRFFPKIAELRDLSGAGAAAVSNVEAEAAWEFVQKYLRKWGHRSSSCVVRWEGVPSTSIQPQN
jgi:hypothetical protein